MASKLLIVGQVAGQLRAVFKKVAALHAKNDFALVIITGNLFGDEDDEVTAILSGEIPVPVSTYFTVGNAAFPLAVLTRLESGQDICENLHYLDKRSVTKTAEGIRIVTLGGMLDEAIVGGISKEQFLPFHTRDDGKALIGANTADILLTTAWPTNVKRASLVRQPDAAATPTAYDHISDLVLALKPRYHFSSSPDFYYEREPFFYAPEPDSPDARPITRFLSLAQHGNPGKQKALFALTLQAERDLSTPIPVGATVCPFVAQKTKKRIALDPAPYSRFSNHDRGRGSKRTKRAPPPMRDTCFFCLSNENIGTHLIVSIGEEAYMTIAKGPLVTSSTNEEQGLDFPAHALIVPLAHEPTLAMNDANMGRKIYTEMIKYKTALQAMVSMRSVSKLGAVTYEICRADGFHTHWQFVPVPLEIISKGLVEAAFKVEAENYQYHAFESRDVGLGENEGEFFRVWIWTPPSDEDGHNDGKTTCMLLPLDRQARFDLQFGRRVLAKLLGLESRMQWRDCVQETNIEEAETNAFKEAFQEYDFTT